MTTDDGLKGLTDAQITAFFDYVDDERGNAAKAHYKSADSDKSWESKRTGIIANAARQWLAANVPPVELDTGNLVSDPLYKALDDLYLRGWQDRHKERDYDPRGTNEWQAVLDLFRLAANFHDSGDGDRLDWLACGGWEVMQDPDMWPPNLNFRESIDYGIEFVRADAAILAEKGEV